MADGNDVGNMIGTGVGLAVLGIGAGMFIKSMTPPQRRRSKKKRKRII